MTAVKNLADTKASYKCCINSHCDCSAALSQRYRNVSVTSLRQIEVARVEGQWVAVNGNRRLYVLKKLLSRGKLNSPLIPVKELPGTGDRDIAPTTLNNLRVRRGRNMWKELDDVIDGIVVMPDSNLGSSQDDGSPLRTRMEDMI